MLIDSTTRNVDLHPQALGVDGLVRSAEASTFSGGGIEVQALTMNDVPSIGHPWAVDFTSKTSSVTDFMDIFWQT